MDEGDCCDQFVWKTEVVTYWWVNDSKGDERVVISLPLGGRFFGSIVYLLVPGLLLVLSFVLRSINVGHGLYSSSCSVGQPVLQLNLLRAFD